MINIFLAKRCANFQSLLDAAQTTSEKLKVITVNLAKIGGASGAAYAAVQAVLQSEKVQKAIQVIMTWF